MDYSSCTLLASEMMSISWLELVKLVPTMAQESSRSVGHKEVTEAALLTNTPAMPGNQLNWSERPRDIDIPDHLVEVEQSHPRLGETASNGAASRVALRIDAGVVDRSIGNHQPKTEAPSGLVLMG